jgi:hypothetical protein
MTQPRASSPLTSLKGVITLEITPQSSSDTADILPFASREAASDLAQWVAQDLDRLFPGLRQSGIILAGAIYDQTEVLTPGLTLFETLETMYVDAVARDSFEAQIISLGSVEGEFPVTHLQPKSQTLRGPLLLIPFAIVGPQAALEALADDFDDRLLNEGACSTEVQSWLVDQFKVTLHHAQYLSLVGLCALVQTHLYSAGLEPFWKILETALVDPEGTSALPFDLNQEAIYHQKKVTLPFITFSEAAQLAQADGATLSPKSYLQFVRSLRQTALGLEAHTLSVDWQTPTTSERIGDLVVERSEYLPDHANSNDSKESKGLTASPTAARVALVEQNDPELGTVAWVLSEFDLGERLLRRTTLYPLSPLGLVQLRETADSLIAPEVETSERETLELEISSDGLDLI